MKMIQRLPLLVILICAAGCAQTATLYSPPAAHAPLFDSAGGVDITLLSNIIGSIDPRVAYSPFDHLMLFGAGSWYDARSDSGTHAYHAYGEFGIGGYTALSPRLTGEVSIGGGYGKAVGFDREEFTAHEEPARLVSGSYRRYFGQLALGYRTRRDSSPTTLQSSYTVVFRASTVRFDHISKPDSTTSGSGWFLEPILVSRIGQPALQFECQIGFTSSADGFGFGVVSPFLLIGVNTSLHHLF